MSSEHRSSPGGHGEAWDAQQREDQLVAMAEAGQKLAVQWGHPPWSDSWARLVAETLDSAAARSDSYWLTVQDARVEELQTALRNLCDCVQDVEFGFRESAPPAEYVRARKVLAR